MSGSYAEQQFQGTVSAQSRWSDRDQRVGANAAGSRCAARGQQWIRQALADDDLDSSRIILEYNASHVVDGLNV